MTWLTEDLYTNTAVKLFPFSKWLNLTFPLRPWFKSRSIPPTCLILFPLLPSSFCFPSPSSETSHLSYLCLFICLQLSWCYPGHAPFFLSDVDLHTRTRTTMAVWQWSRTWSWPVDTSPGSQRCPTFFCSLFSTARTSCLCGRLKISPLTLTGEKPLSIS